MCARPPCLFHEHIGLAGLDLAPGLFREMLSRAAHGTNFCPDVDRGDAFVPNPATPGTGEEEGSVCAGKPAMIGHFDRV